jgi:hypothetical protein
VGVAGIRDGVSLAIPTGVLAGEALLLILRVNQFYSRSDHGHGTRDNNV